MSYVYRMAGEDLKLAGAEISGFLESQGIEEVEFEDGYALAASEPRQLKRLALVHEVCEVIGKTQELDKLDYSPDSSFRVRSDEDGRKLEKKAGSILDAEKNSVELEDPEEDLRLYRVGDEYVLGRVVEDIERGLFEKRANQERVFSSPVSLDPVLARVMVNLSGVEAGGSIIDPFCGTGGILIESGLCGIKPHGLDIQEKMVEGARQNLESYGILNHDIRERAVKDAPGTFDRKFDAVVTDLPYGQASKTEGNPLEDFLEVAPELTDGRIVFMSDQPEIQGLEPEFEIYEHKNLTRYVYSI
ncbi:MAG: methyltransferase domain-containing protein [Candidatus Nanohaloarchaea archaeon]